MQELSGAKTSRRMRRALSVPITSARKAPPDMLTGQSKRACLCREVPTPQTTKHAASAAVPATEAEYTRSMVASVLRLITRARGRRAQRLVSPVNHVQHVSEHAVHTSDLFSTKQFMERHDDVTQGVMDKQGRSSIDEYLRKVSTHSMARSRRQEAKRADPQRAKRANSRGRAVPTAGKNSHFIVHYDVGQKVINVTDKVADVPITTRHQLPTIQWLRRSRRQRRFHRCSAVSEIEDTPVPQVEVEQTVEESTHSSKLEADVQ